MTRSVLIQKGDDPYLRARWL